MRGKDALRALFQAFEDRGAPIPLKDLLSSLVALDITRDDVAEAVRFDGAGYQRIIIHHGTHFEALVLCWQSGQGSPIHDHAGSSCAVRIVEGRATETTYRRSPSGQLYPSQSRSYKQGSVTGCHDQGTHQVANLQPAGQNLITLHVYSPPPSEWSYYRLDDTTLAGHDRVIENRPETLRVDLGHEPTPAPHVHAPARRGVKA